MRGCQDEEFYWIRSISLKIHVEKSLGREKPNSLAMSVVSILVAILFSPFSFASPETE